MRSIPWRGVLRFALFLGIVLTVVCSFLYVSIEQALYRMKDQVLLERIAASAAQEFQPAENHVFVQVSALDGSLLRKSLNLQDPLPLTVETRQEVLTGKELVFTTEHTRSGDLIRVATYLKRDKSDQAAGFLQVGVPLSDVRRLLSEVFYRLVAGGFLLFGILLAATAFFLNQSLRPVRTAIQMAKEIGTSGIPRRRLVVADRQSESWKLAQTFNEMLDRLEKTLRSQQRFIADAAHELRTPLTVLQGEIEVALRKSRPAEEYQEVMKSSLEEIRRLSRLINNLLILAQADSGERPAHHETFDLKTVCLQVCEKLAPLIREKKIDLRVEGDPVPCTGDQTGLERMIFNLVENAIQYTPEGNKVWIQFGEANGHIKLAVCDTGVGIPEEDLPHIFERFYRVDKARTREQGGGGLGLAIAKTIVTVHGGTIEVTSELNEGTTFTVLLPRR